MKKIIGYETMGLRLRIIFTSYLKHPKRKDGDPRITVYASMRASLID